MMMIFRVFFSEVKVDCIRVSTIPIKTVIDDHIQRLFDALLGSLRRSIQSDITEIETFVTEALETLSQRPQTVEEIGEANVKHMEFTKRKKEVLTKFQLHASCSILTVLLILMSICNEWQGSVLMYCPSVLVLMLSSSIPSLFPFPFPSS